MADTPPPPGPPGKPIDDWFEGRRPPWDGSGPAPEGAPAVEGEPVAPEPEVVMPVARSVTEALPEAKPVNRGPRAVPRPEFDPKKIRVRGDGPATNLDDRPKSQVFLACSVLLAIIAAMMMAVAVLGYVIVVGLQQAQDRAKVTNPPAVRPAPADGAAPQQQRQNRIRPN